MPTRVLQPMIASSRGYNVTSLRRDALAGLTVAVVAVPQCMAYALIAGVPVQYGLYSLIIQCLVGSLFNSQRFLSVGPIITQSLLVASTVTRLVSPGSPELYLQLVIGLTLFKGVIQLAMAGARLGGLVRYVSQSVIVGFTAGAGVLIAAGQIHWFLGFAVEKSSKDWPGVVGIFQQLLRHIDEVRWVSALLGLGCLLAVVFAKRISRFIPGPLIAVIGAAAVVALFSWTDNDLALMGQLPPAGELVDIFKMPQLSIYQVERLFGGAVALSLLGLLEVYSIGKTIANKTGDNVSANQELFSQGLTHIVSAFFQCMPGSASFSRSALNHYAGARTAYAGIFNGIFSAVIFFGLAHWVGYVPMTALAAILFVIAYGLIDVAYLTRVIRSNRADAVVCIITFVATLTVPLAYAVFVGIFLNLALYLRRASQLHLAEMVPTGAGPFIERPLQEKNGGRRVMFLQIEGDLFFGVADELQNKLAKIQSDPVRVVIFRLKRTHSIDSTVMQVLEQFTRDMQAHGGHVLLCGVRPELLEVMSRFGLVKTIGEDNVFETGYGVFTSAQRALDRARELVKGSIDTDGLPEKDEVEGWAYEI